MRRSILLVLSITFLVTFAGAQVAVTPSGYATLPGPAIIPAVPSPPLLTTPVVNLGIASPNPVGATNATAGNQAGATNSTLSGVPAPTKSVTTVPAYMTSESSPETLPVVVGTAPGQQTAQSQQPFNLGAAQLSSAYNATARPVTQSLAQIARQYRKKDATENAKVYTNEDVEKLPQPTTGGITGAVQSAAPQSAPTVQEQPQRPVPATPVTPQSNPKPLQNQSSISQERTTYIAEAQPAAKMGSMAGQRTESTENQNSGQEAHKAGALPSSASRLPLIAVLGLGLGFTGLLLRR